MYVHIHKHIIYIYTGLTGARGKGGGNKDDIRKKEECTYMNTFIYTYIQIHTNTYVPIFIYDCSLSIQKLCIEIFPYIKIHIRIGYAHIC